MKRKNILYIGNDLRDASFTATYISFLSLRLIEEGFSVKTASDKANKFLRLKHMLQLIWRNRHTTDLVLIDTYAASNFYYAYAASRLCHHLKLDYIPILHGGRLPLRLKDSKRFSRFLFGNALLNLAPSAYLHHIFRSEGFPKTRIIPNSIMLADYPFKERREFRPKFLWVRRFQELYNPMMALKFLQEVLRKYPEAELCMVGPGKDASLATCMAFSREHSLPVIFPGKLETHEWVELSTNYDYFLNTSQIDNMPVSVMEAMALGLPVISTNVGGMPFLIQDQEQGILVPANDSKRMAEAFFNLMEDQEKSRQIARAARVKAETYDWNTVKKQWLEALE